MTAFLNRDGSGYVNLDSTITVLASVGDYIELRIKPTDDADNYILGTGGRFALGNTGNDQTLFRLKADAVDYVFSGLDDFSNTLMTIRVERLTASSLAFTIPEISLDETIEGPAEAPDLYRLLANSGGVFGTNGKLYYFEIGNSSGATDYFNPASANGTGTVLPNDIGTVDATLVNFPNDDSANWGIETATPTNPSPTIVTNGNQSDIAADATVTLDASTSTIASGSIASFSWTQLTGPNVTLTNANTATATYTAPTQGTDSTLTFRVTATSDLGEESTSDVTHGVLAEVGAPIFSCYAGEDKYALSGAEFMLDGRGSLIVNGSEPVYPGNYFWTQVSGPAVTLTRENTAVPRFIAPTVTNPTPLVFELYTTDGAETSSTDTVTITVVTAAELPTAVATTNNSSPNTGDTVALSASSSTGNSAIVDYKWTQKSGAYARLDDKFSATPSFTVPQADAKTAYAQDIFGNAEIITPSNYASLLPVALNKLLDISYLGAFRVEYSDATSTTEYSSGAIAVSSDGNSLFATSHVYEQAVGEFNIPTLSTSGVYLDLPIAPNLQPFTFALSQNTVDPRSNDRMNGILEYNGKLLISSENDYNTGDPSPNIQFLSNSENLSASTNTGLMNLGGESKSGGWLTKVPNNAISLIGGEYVAGWSSVRSITSRYSQGPSLYVFNPEDVVTANAGDNVASTELMVYPYGGGNELVVGGDLYLKDTDPLWGSMAKGRYGFIIPNTNYYMVVGTHAGLNDGVGYKITNDEGELGGGPDSYVAADKYSYYWLYDLNDIVNATNPHDPVPFSYGKWMHPFDNRGRVGISSASFDEINNKLYINLNGANTENGGTFSRHQTVLVYDLQAKSQEVTTVGSDVTDMVFEVEVTDANGLKSTDTVTVSMASQAQPDTTAPIITVSGNASTTIAFGGTVPTFTASTDDGSTVVVGGDTVDNNTAGTYVITYNATDANENQAEEVTRTVIVEPEVVTPPTNTAPSVTVTANKATYEAGEDIIFTATASDPESDTLTYSWSDGGDTAQSITVVAPTSSSASTVTRTCTVSDGLLTSNDSVTVNVNAEVVTPPTEEANMLARATFTLQERFLNAYRNTDNVQILKFKSTEGEQTNSFFDFDENSITRVEVSLRNSAETVSIDSDAAHIGFSGNELSVCFGAFDVVGNCQVIIKVYSATLTNGLVVCAPGYRESNLLVNVYE